MNGEKSKKTIAVVFTSCAIVVVIVVVALFLMNGHETRVSKAETTAKQEIVQCSALALPDAFFNTDETVSDVSYNIKYMYEESDLQSASFNYRATFETEEIANNVLAGMKYKFYEYVANANVDSSVLSPVLNRYNNEISISLYFDQNNLASNLSDLLFLDKIEAAEIKKYSIEKLKKIYKNKGFSCYNNEFNKE